MKQLSKYSIGMGDRFAHQGNYQLKALVEASKKFGTSQTASIQLLAANQ